MAPIEQKRSFTAIAPIVSIKKGINTLILCDIILLGLSLLIEWIA